MSQKHILVVGIVVTFCSLTIGYHLKGSGNPGLRNKRAAEQYEELKKPTHYDDIIAVQKENDKKPQTIEFNDEVVEETPAAQGRGFSKFTWAYWRDYKMIVVIESTYTDEQREQIISAIYTLKEALKCFDFQILAKGSEGTPDSSHVFIRNKPFEAGCNSLIGRRATGTDVAIGEACHHILYGATLHEMMHALGFYHEQSRPDRDDFVEVSNNYYKKEDYQTTVTPYDFDSIMHYPFGSVMKAKPGKVPNGVIVGQHSHLSEGDIKRLQAAYACDKKPKPRG